MAILTPARAKALHVRMFDCGRLAELVAIGREIRATYARTDADRQENAVQLAKLRTAYDARRDMMGRG